MRAAARDRIRRAKDFISAKVGKNIAEKCCFIKKVRIFAVPKRRVLDFARAESGRSSVRLEYTSGGRVVAGSNPVTPTEGKA